jgi:hypothetical protein
MGITTMASVYDGRQCVGFVLNHLDRRVFEAVDTENHSYGCLKPVASKPVPTSKSAPVADDFNDDFDSTATRGEFPNG